MIPKIIHYCWFGQKEKPKSVIKCIATWERYLPDYEIREWNETNVDLSEYDFAKEAYECKKYAFVSDVVRLKVLYEYGGIYFDTDVEVLKSFDRFLMHDAFMSFETDETVGTAVIGACKNSLFIKDCLLYYKDKNFLLSDGSLNVIPNPYIFRGILKDKKIIYNNQLQNIDNGYLTIYPKTYFSAKHFPSGKLVVTKNTHSIHHFNATWFTPWQKFKLKIHHLLKI